MEQAVALPCTICGEVQSANQSWFLVVEDRWRDKLKILHWDERLAAVPGVHGVCSAGHLQQLVVHWMTTGSVDHPFARAEYCQDEYPRRRSPRPPMETLESSRVRQIGELSVHRESIRRVLGERPESLQTILDALLSALQRGPRPEREVSWNQGNLSELRQA
jgi:hypothetical protein